MIKKTTIIKDLSFTGLFFLQYMHNNRNIDIKMKKLLLPEQSKRSILPLILFVMVLLLYGCGGSGSGGNNSSTPVSSGIISLKWSTPERNSDGSPMSDLAGFIVYYGTSSGNYNKSVDVGDTNSFSSAFPPGTYCFTLTAYDTHRNESKSSNEVCKSAGSQA